MVTRACWLSAALLLCLTGCLTAPELKECIDFKPDEIAENSVCADGCDTYCQALVRICPDQATGADPVAACMAGCQEFGEGKPQQDALACRFGALRAARDNPDSCESAGIGGGDLCSIGPCAEYCFLARRDCEGMYASDEQCAQICETFPQDGSSQEGDSVQCRIGQLNMLADEGCNAASIASDGTCGDTCEGYCAQVLAHCDGDNRIYADEAECRAACETLPQGQFSDWGGTVGANSLMCRAYHASSPAQDDAQTHCPHAKVFNDSKCGSVCDTFCDEAMCGGQFVGVTECFAECNRLVAEAGPDPDLAATLRCDQ